MKRGGFLQRRSGLKRGGALKRTVGHKKTCKTPKLPKPKVWGLKRADDHVSLIVRKRDGRCMFPGCTEVDIKKLQCSHYIGRAHKATRFYLDNLIALCWFHHFKSKLLGFEYQKQTVEKQGWDGQYTLFMKKWLGEEKFAQLIALGRTTKKQYDAILECMSLV